jgi:hypothetical protein
VAHGTVDYELSRIESARVAMAALFARKSTRAQMELRTALERGGAALYRSFASSEPDAERRRSLVESAAREEADAQALERAPRT